MPQEVTPQKTPQPVASKGVGTASVQSIKKKNSWLGICIWLVLLIIAGAVAYHFWQTRNQTTATSSTGGKSRRGGAGDTIRVVGATATLGNIGVYLNGLGSVTPLNVVTVKSRVDGQLMQVLFQEGQMVKKDDLLVQIDDRPFKAQVAQFTAQKEHDEALLENAKIDLDRYQTLWKQDSIPQQQLATQEALVKQDQGTVDSDQAQIDTAQLNVVYCHITAPISGRIGLRLVDEGNQVHASDTNGLVVITQVQPITVVFTIPEDSIQPVLDKLRTSQTLVVEAYDRDMKNKLTEGTLLTTDNQIDQTTGTLKLKAAFANANNELFPNQFVNVRLLVEMKKDVTLVPVAAIQHGTQGTFVYIIDTTADPKTVRLQTITVGTIDNNQAEISGGVTPGDTVVTDGVDKLQDGSKVILQTSDPNAPPSADDDKSTPDKPKHGDGSKKKKHASDDAAQPALHP